MLEHEFNEQVTRLTKAYGDKAFNSERAALIWNKFKNEDIENFKSTVDHLILNNRTAPLIDDFYNSRKFVRINASRDSDSECKDCSTGWILPYYVYDHKDPRNATPLVVRRCQCLGGPPALVSYLRKKGDSKTADRIESDEMDPEFRELFSLTKISEYKQKFGVDPVFKRA